MSSAEEVWRQAILPANATIQQAIRNLDQVATKIVLVVNEASDLEGTISDGDIRRGLLKGLDLNSPIGAHSHISVGATLAGNVSVGRMSHVGAASVVLQGVSLGASCIVAAGAVVIRNVLDEEAVAGAPARRMKK